LRYRSWLAVGRLSNLLEPRVLGFGLRTQICAAAGRRGRRAGGRFGFRNSRHRRCSSWGRGRWRRRLGGGSLGLSRAAIPRRREFGTFVVRGTLLFHSLQLPLQLPLAFLGRFEFCALGGEFGFLFLCAALGFFLPTLLFLFLNLALLDLFLEGTKASLLCFLFFHELLLALSSLVSAGKRKHEM
jgi:hypothetical protein